MSSLPGGHSGLLWEMSPSLLLFPCSSKVGLEVAQEVLLPSSSICRSRHRWLVSPSHPWRQTGELLFTEAALVCAPLNWPTEDWENISVTCSHHEEKYPFAKVWLCDDCGWPIFFPRTGQELQTHQNMECDILVKRGVSSPPVKEVAKLCHVLIGVVHALSPPRRDLSWVISWAHWQSSVGREWTADDSD